MYIGTIRPLEHRTVSATGSGIPEVQALVSAQVPEGWAIASMPFAKQGSSLHSDATLVRRDDVQTIEGADIDAVRAAVPDGFQLLSITPA